MQALFSNKSHSLLYKYIHTTGYIGAVVGGIGAPTCLALNDPCFGSSDMENAMGKVFTFVVSAPVAVPLGAVAGAGTAIVAPVLFPIFYAINRRST